MKEKYINEKESAKGKYFRVYINYDDCGKRAAFSKNVRIDDYPSRKVALDVAKGIRDQALLDIRAKRIRKMETPTIKEIYEKKFEIFPVSLKTKQKHYIYFQALADFKDTPIGDITVEQIQISINKYAETHSKGAVKRILILWGQLYKTAQIMGIPVTDKTLNITKPKSKVVTIRRDVNISVDDFNAFLDALLNYGNDPYYTRTIWYLLKIMYYTGMRPAEVLALTRDDINLATGLIRVNKAVGSDFEKKTVIIPTKTESSVRTVPIAPELAPILTDLFKRSKNQYLISSEGGDLLEIDSVTNTISLVSRSCKIPFRSYMLRHKFATDMIRNGVDNRTVQDLLGHTSYSMSLEYARSDEETKAAAIKNRK